MNTLERLRGRAVAGETSRAIRCERLSMLPVGGSAVIVGLEGDNKVARRLYDLGFAPGHPVGVRRRSLFGDRGVFRIAGAEIALRRQQAAMILVEVR
jgi:ferrous iron transport protein A